LKHIACLTLFAAWSLLLSCDGVESAIQYPMTFVKSKILPMGSWRVFNKDGEVTDKNTFRDLVSETDTTGFRYATENILKSTSLDIVRIMSPTEGSVRGYPNSPNCMVASNETGFVFTNKDTTGASICREQMTKHINYFIGSVKPDIFSEYLGSSTAGNFCFVYTGRQKFVFNGHPLAFYAPYIIFIVRTNTGTAPTYGETVRLNNNLAQDFYKHLGENESVSLMEYQLLFERK
jgi:hypothetical protein